MANLESKVSLCKNCYREAVARDPHHVEAVRQLARNGEWVCPWSDPNCGKVAHV